jgi:hypothetical protein
MKNLINKQVYIPFKGGSVYGEGVIKEKEANDTNVHDYVFIGKKGKIYFNTVEDIQVKGMKVLLTPQELLTLKD